VYTYLCIHIYIYIYMYTYIYILGIEDMRPAAAPRGEDSSSSFPDPNNDPFVAAGLCVCVLVFECVD